MNLKYDNITISGGVAVGTTTLLNNLKPYLEPLGFKCKSTGQFIRHHIKENVMPLATLVSDDFDREVEREVEETLNNEKRWAIEGWLAGFVARDLKHTLRVILVCSHDSVRIDRVVNRDKVSYEQAKQFIKHREEENFKKWKRVYGDHDFFDPSYYHLSIDTAQSGPLETVGRVLDAIGFEHKPKK